MTFDAHRDYGVCVPHALVIDTDAYAGNFEREMCSWITGFEGEYYPGGIEYIVNTAQEQLGKTSRHIIDLMGGVNDDEFGRCEVVMTNSPGQTRDYHSVAILFERKPSKELLQLMAERARSFPDAQYQNWARKGRYNMDNFEKLEILNVRFESFKIKVEKTEVTL